MNKKGFTLTELIAILVIISIVALIAVPAVINSIKNNNHDSYNGVVNDIILASETYAANMGASIVQVSVETLKQAGYLPTDLKNPIDNTNLNGCVYVVNGDPIYKEETCSTIIRNVDGVRLYKDGVLNGLDPVLDTGLIPVTIADDGTVTKASLATKWYDYTEKKWANAVILKGSDNYLEGQTIPESEIDAYFVWIPKFKYKLFDMGNYNSTSGNSKPANTSGQIIDIVFDPVNTTDSDTSCATPLISGESGNCAVDKYMTHPAFITMDVNGIWVGKFATGGTTSDVEIKPNISYLTNINVSTMFNTAYNYNRDLDSHMMKNTEWGAVAYLSHSNYGINGEVRINNTSSHITGCAATSTTSFNTSSSTCQNAYNTATGYLASTTGNITGVYDMTASHYTAGYVSGKQGSAGFSGQPISVYDSKYFDVYNASSGESTFKYRILGDAIGEVGKAYVYTDGGANRWHSSWHEDYMYFMTSTDVWSVRGGGFDVGSPLAGVFASNPRGGQAINYITYGIVLAPKQATEEPSNDAPVNTCEYAVNDDWTFDYTGDIQNFTVPCTGTYKLETWGAQGGTSYNSKEGKSLAGGKGGYSGGNINLNKNDALYVYVGGVGTNYNSSVPSVAGGYNGGGSGYNGSSSAEYGYGAGGGGATDIRIGTDSIYSRVIVAGGGGGGSPYYAINYDGNYGAGGGTTGIKCMGANYSASIRYDGGTQTTGGTACWWNNQWAKAENGTFGQGGNGIKTTHASSSNVYSSNAGGGGGWYGGGAGVLNGGSGGSGWVYTESSYNNWVTNSTEGQSGNWLLSSNYYLSDATTVNGNTAMPTHDGTSTMTGNTGNGYAKITLISY